MADLMMAGNMLEEYDGNVSVGHISANAVERCLPVVEMVRAGVEMVGRSSGMMIVGQGIISMGRPIGPTTIRMVSARQRHLNRQNVSETLSIQFEQVRRRP